MTKLLCRRIKPVLPQIIKSSQLCTVGGKNILFGARNIISSILYVNSKRKGACLLSLDFFKAYDRVLVSFLLAVMKKMGFGSVFCKWINMLHENAQTKFLLRRMSKAIKISFSIRQGDPIAMLLYILYVEPLLVLIENRIHGLKLMNIRAGISNIDQGVEAYCDDVNILTDDINDFNIVDRTVTEFEEVSGAILSRNNKCKVLGLGKWKNKKNWPLQYLQLLTH